MPRAWKVRSVMVSDSWAASASDPQYVGSWLEPGVRAPRRRPRKRLPYRVCLGRADWRNNVCRSRRTEPIRGSCVDRQRNCATSHSSSKLPTSPPFPGTGIVRGRLQLPHSYLPFPRSDQPSRLVISTWPSRLHRGADSRPLRAPIASDIAGPSSHRALVIALLQHDDYSSACTIEEQADAVSQTTTLISDFSLSMAVVGPPSYWTGCDGAGSGGGKCAKLARWEDGANDKWLASVPFRASNEARLSFGSCIGPAWKMAPQTYSTGHGARQQSRYQAVYATRRNPVLRRRLTARHRWTST